MDLDEVSPASAVFAFIRNQAVAFKRVNVPWELISKGTGLAHFVVEVALDILADAKLCSSWNPGPGPVATLTPGEVSRLGLKLRRVEGKGGYQYMPKSLRDPKERRVPMRTQAATDAGIPELDEVEGPAPDPAAVVEAAEQLEAEAPRQAGRLSDEDLTRPLPRPAIVLMGCRPWTDGFPGRVADPARGDHPDLGAFDPKHGCPGCHGKKLRPSVYCLVCDRWGLDRIHERQTRARAEAEAAEAAARAKANRFRPKGAPSAEGLAEVGLVAWPGPVAVPIAT